jgi:AraC-like DNA-binding protein
VSASPDPGLPRYEERPPSAQLAPWVECFWTMRATNAAGISNRVLPDGCSDVIVGLPDVPGPVVVGTMRCADVYPLTGPVDYFGVRFRPGRARPFLGVPLEDVTDLRVPLDELWGMHAREVAEAGAKVRVATIERVLNERLRAAAPGPRDDEALVAGAVNLLRQSRGGATVRDVAAALGIGERRLERAFGRCVGLGPKAFARVLRFRRAIDRIARANEPGAPRTWTALAFDAGYADQPHFIREFKALAGLTPVRYAAERHGVGFVQYADAEPE